MAYVSSDKPTKFEGTIGKPKKPEDDEIEYHVVNGKKYHFSGWKPDAPDSRDWKFTVEKPKAVPATVDLRSKCVGVYDQKSLGSCVSNAVASAHKFDQKKQGAKIIIDPARLFIYYNARLLEGTVNSDSGSSIRDGIKSIAKYGACLEGTWPYVVSKYKAKPSATAYTEGEKHQAVQYYRLNQTLDDMKQCLAEGYPFEFGFQVYSSFVSSSVTKTGIVNMPTKSEKILGGHGVLACGCDDTTQRFIVLNSWGSDFGDHGFFTIPYDYLTNTKLASDFWTMRVVENPAILVKKNFLVDLFVGLWDGIKKIFSKLPSPSFGHV